MVRVRKSRRKCLHAQTLEPGKERGDIADERTWATWDHYSNSARIQEGEQTKNITKGDEEEVDWMETKY